MDIRNFGTSDLRVSALGFGSGSIGGDNVSDKQASNLLNNALDIGVTMIDTARSYGAAEERIGKYISQRRNEYVLSTKVGYGIEGVPDWTYQSVISGVHEALTKMKTEYIDVVYLHSCPAATLEHGEVIDALDNCIEQGKVKLAAYSGDNDDLAFAVNTGRFGAMMGSLNFCDQRIIDNILYEAKNRGMGMVAKRPVANAPWRFDERPHGNYCEEYWHRWKTLAIETDIEWTELAIRFAAFTYGVDSCVVGTSRLSHLKHNVSCVEKGKLPDELVKQIREKFWHWDDNWVGQL